MIIPTLLALLTLNAAHADTPSEMDKILAKLQACATEHGYPKVKGCSAKAARDAMALIDKSVAGANTYLDTAARQDARFARAAEALNEAHRSWKTYVEAHCRFRMEFNGIGADNLEFRTNECRLTQAQQRFETFGNSVMK